MGDYIPAPVKAELKEKGIMQGLIPRGTNNYSPKEGIDKNSKKVIPMKGFTPLEE